MSQALALTPQQIKRVLKTCLAMPDSEIKRCALVLSFAAMRVTEIALLETKTILTPAGNIRKEIHLPSKICKFCKPRTVWLTSELSRAIIQEWIDYRLKRRWGTKGEKFQGLNPESRFLYSNRGRPYSIQPQPRKLKKGNTKIYQACDSLEAMIRNIYKKCGLKGASSHTGRRSFCTNAIEGGFELEQVAFVLGHSDTQTTLMYLQYNDQILEDMYSKVF